MSLVIAIKEEDRIIMGCDSKVSSGNRYYQCDNIFDCKIFEVKNCPHCLVGGVGSLRDMQLVQCCEWLIAPENILTGNITYEYMVTSLSLTLQKLFKKYDTKPDNMMIVAYEDNAWLICSDYGVVPIKDYLAIGSGAEVATGVLEDTKGESAESRIRKAIKAASDTTLYVDDNIVIKDTAKV